MMSAVKHGDAQVDMEIRPCLVPQSTAPVSIPMPQTSIVFDPFDYVPAFGSAVEICGMACAPTDAAGDGSTSSGALPVLSCQTAGLTPPEELHPKYPSGPALLPAAVNLPIPTSVVVAGGQAISRTAKGFTAAISPPAKAAAGPAAYKQPKAPIYPGINPEFIKCPIRRAGSVNILSGEVSVEQMDFTLPGQIPIQWRRTYASSSRYAGVCGHGWETPADIRLMVDPSNSFVTMVTPGSVIAFDRLPDGPSNGPADDAAVTGLPNGARLTDHQRHYRVLTRQGLNYYFYKALGQANPEGSTSYPVGRIADPCGNWWSFEHSSGKLIGLRESTGRYLEIITECGRIQKIILQLPGDKLPQRLVQYQYDSAGDLIAVIDPMHQAHTFVYDGHHMVRQTDRNRHSFDYRYETFESHGRRVVQALSDGGRRFYTFEYLDALNERRITDTLGHTATVKLNDTGLPISEIDAMEGMTLYEYDDAGRTIAVTDPDQHRTEFQYDAAGNLTKLTRPDGGSVQTKFNTPNKAVRITDPNGRQWLQKWDQRGLLLVRTTPLGSETRYTYDALGRLIQVVNPKGGRTRLDYDRYGNLTRLTNPLGHTTTFNYDTLGNRIAKIDPADRTTRYEYDAKGRLRKVESSGKIFVACAYDSEDHLILHTDENGARTQFEYGDQGKIRRIIQPDDHTVQYHYDTEGRLTGITNPRGQRQLIRDPLGRVVEEIDEWGQSWKYQYSAAGVLQKIVDSQDGVIEFQSDPMGRIIQKLLPDPMDAGKMITETFFYDANGRLTACENHHIRIERKFDAEGRLVEERQGDVAVISNTYDPNGNRLTRNIDLKTEERRYTHTVQYRYDTLDQAVGVVLADFDPMHFERNSLGQVIEEKLSPYLRRHLTYNPQGDLTGQQVIAKEEPQFEQHYRFDRVGHMVEKNDSILGVDRFTFDPMGRVVSHLNPEEWAKEYSRDQAGDRLQTRVKHISGTQSNEPWRRDGELDGIYYSFDHNGNMTERRSEAGVIRLRWDLDHRLVESKAQDRSTSYANDPLGRRISIKTADTTTYFFWDGEALLGDLIVNDAPNNAQGRPPVREWIYRSATRNPLAMLSSCDEDPSELYLYHNDSDGCPTRMMDSAGRIVWLARYDALGAVDKLITRTIENPLRISGQYADYETKLNCDHHKYYDARLGAFINKDPLTDFAAEERLYCVALRIANRSHPARYTGSCLNRWISKRHIGYRVRISQGFFDVMDQKGTFNKGAYLLFQDFLNCNCRSKHLASVCKSQALILKSSYPLNSSGVGMVSISKVS